jgi:23S rRNA pseudouridine2605 synthase
MAVRLQKHLADAGIASRRAAEVMIREGHVAVNGRVTAELGIRIDPERDRVTVDGRVVRQQRKLYVALNKPRGYTSSRHDPHAKHLVAELLPAEWTSLYPVGRLDRDSEGLLFLTNDGEFCLRLTHPRYRVTKEYRVIVAGRVEPAHLARFRHGIVADGERLRILSGRIFAANPAESVVELELSEGRYREIRRLFATVGLEVRRLVRTRIGTIKLGELRTGRWRTLTPAERKTLLAPL